MDDQVLRIEQVREGVREMMGGKEVEIFACYLMGSMLYGWWDSLSDVDVKVVVRGEVHEEGVACEVNGYDITLYSLENWCEMVRENDIMALIPVFGGSVVEGDVDMREYFYVDLRKLKNSVVKEAGQTWAKSKLLWTNEQNYRSAKKNIVHSIRYLMFGLQIVEYGKITDFTIANHLSEVIMNKEWDSFDEMRNEFQKEYKEIGIRKLCLF